MAPRVDFALLLDEDQYINQLKILKTKSQISPLSGSVKKQIVRLIGKDEMILNGKKCGKKEFQYF